MEKPVLKAKEVKKYFGNVRAVDGVSIDIMENEILGIVGPNGAGKTTLLNLLSGIIPPDSGKILLLVRDRYIDITGWSPAKIAKLGVGRSFQIPNVFDMLSVLDNVKLALYAFNREYLGVRKRYKTDSRLTERALEILEIFGLKGKEGVLAGRLSHGERKALDIAVAFALKPRVLLLDEPTSGLSATEKKSISRFIRRLREEEGITIAFVEHDLDIVYSTADRMIVMYEGSILAEGAPDKVREDPQVKRVYLGEEYEA